MRDIKLENMNEEEINGYQPIFQCIYDLFGEFVGVFYKIYIDGKEHLLQRADDLFALYTCEYTEEQPIVGYQMFTVDEEYKIQTAGFDDFEMRMTDGHRCIQYRDSHNVHLLELVKRGNGLDVDGYDGYAMFVQYNQEQDVRLTMTYQQMNNYRGEVYGYHVNKDPFQIIIERGLHANTRHKWIPIRKDKYIRTDINNGEIAYGSNAIREYGLIEFLKKGPYELHRENTIFRYYKIMFQIPSGEVVTTYPLGAGYKIEAFSDIFEKYGFSKTISDDLLKICNGTHEELLMYEDVAKVVGEFEKDNTKDVAKLVLTFGGVEENGQDS